MLQCIETRLEVGLDPLLKIIRELLKNGFESSNPTRNDMMQDGINMAKRYHKTELFRIFLLPDRSVAVNKNTRNTMLEIKLKQFKSKKNLH